MTLLGNPLTPTIKEPTTRRLVQRWALLGAFVLYVGHVGAGVHLHVYEHEEGDCTFCAISETSHVPEGGWVNTQLSERCRSESLPVIPTSLSPHSHAVGHPRAPPIA